MMHGERGARGVVDVHRAQALRPQVDQHERALQRDQRGERFRLDEARHGDRVGRVQAQLLDGVVGGTGGEQRGHDAVFAARVFHAVQDVREERACREVVVLAVQQKGEPADARAQLRAVIAERARHFDDALTGGLGKARLIFQCARHRADRHVCRLRDITNGCPHGSWLAFLACGGAVRPPGVVRCAAIV
jgi:hypothetical protein